MKTFQTPLYINDLLRRGKDQIYIAKSVMLILSFGVLTVLIELSLRFLMLSVCCAPGRCALKDV